MSIHARVLKRPSTTLRSPQAAGALLGVLTVLVVSGTAAVSASSTDREYEPTFQVLHTPPSIVFPGEDVVLEYSVDCPLDDVGNKVVCPDRAEVEIETPDGIRTLPLTQRADGWEAFWTTTVPADALEGGEATYSAEFVDTAAGKAVSVPAEGPSARERLWVLDSATELHLGTHTFGRTAAPDGQALAAKWGRNSDEVGLSDLPEQARIGPTSFDVASDGTVTLLDTINRRLVRATPEGKRTLVPVEISGGIADLAVLRGVAHVLEPHGRPTGRTPAIRSFDASTGAPRGVVHAADAIADRLVTAGGAVTAHQLPSERWMPVVADGKAQNARGQRAMATRGRPTNAAGEQLVVRVTPEEARIAVIDQDSVRAAWRITSETPLGELALDQRHQDGVLLALRVYDEDQTEFMVMQLDVKGLVGSFTVAAAEWAESAPFGQFRAVGDRVYQMPRTESGTAVVYYELKESLR